MDRDALAFDATLAPDQTIDSLSRLLALERAGESQLVAPTLEAGWPAEGVLEALPRLAGPDEGTAELGDLESVAVLGEGGMGVVELARQRSLQREVAVKRAHAGSPARAAALLREALCMGHLEHPNIVPVHALGRDADDRPVLVMRRIEGVPWRELVSNPSHPRWATVRGERLAFHLGVLEQVCHAVHFAHSRGVVHRDIKPDNVMVGAFGEVYLLDWGLGLRLGQPSLEARGALVGTPAYMAPEMAAGEHDQVGVRTDVYLLGATLFEVLTGRPPHDGSSVMDVVLRALRGDAPVLPAEVPAELAALCRRAMAREPADRFPDVADLREALGDFESHRASMALTAAALERLEALRRLPVDPAQHHAARLHRLFDECRFGLQQALSAWPDNAAARTALSGALERMIEHELAAGNRHAAAALLEELGDHSGKAALQARLCELDAAIATQARDRERLRALDHDVDPTVGSRQRAVAFGVLVLVTLVVLPVAFDAALRGLGVQSERLAGLATQSAFALTVIALGVVWRRRFLPNALARRVAGTLGVGMVAIVFHRALAIVAGMPLEHSLVGDMAVLAAVCATAAIAVRPAFATASGAFVVCAVAGAAVPAAAGLAFVCASAASLGFLLVFFLRDAWRHRKTTR